ncbi:Na+/H+ antiporter subunit E [Notoacmeibacter sp. MSK16QG-6]|uniref:Na+/H+ antiporter subunit E n=1 Tax=Notoacmeibacter sp. MSK16QG-6 TaxID=2957982 RepID=UPI0020A186CD|nr:Na+/H+ antiporter subunit E [Notoacmeibacter sp. MSK16QG-6]MCP1198154.1 Na+/H+ antiporter subunit E [Notoacmeibacter sp. MSK16QG-6]
MNLQLMNILLALAWAAVTGSFTLPNLIFGFVLGALGMYFIREQVGSLGYFRRLWRISILVLIFLRELIFSAWRVAILVLTPKMNVQPGIFAYPLRVRGDMQITLLANMITLTPGTLSVDVAEDHSTLWVHALDCSDPEAAKQDIARMFERRIMEAFE